MYDLRFIGGDGSEIIMGHKKSRYIVTKVTGLDSLPVSIVTSQGFGQIGESVDNQSVAGREIGVFGRIYNFSRTDFTTLNEVFRPLAAVRMVFEEKYWIDCVVKESLAYEPALRTAVFSFSLYAPYPFWRSIHENYYKLGGTTGGFNFPVSYDTAHNFGLFSNTLFLNCINRGNVQASYTAEITTSSGSAQNITLTNAENQKFVTVNTTVTSDDLVSIFWENNIMRVTKTTGGIVTDIFSALDEDSNLLWMDVGDNVIRASKQSGAGILVVAVRFFEPITGVGYGV